MTYEPGQQVLVPAVVKGAQTDADPVWVQIPTVFGDRLGWVPAADIVGPAPATPDEGEEVRHIEVVKVRDLDAVTFIDDLRRKLAAAEAERDAWRELAEARNDLLAHYRVGAQYPPERVLRRLDAAKERVSALSVEATGPERPEGYCVLCGCPRWAPHSTDHDPQWVTGFFGEAAGTEGGGGHE